MPAHNRRCHWNGIEISCKTWPLRIITAAAFSRLTSSGIGDLATGPWQGEAPVPVRSAGPRRARRQHGFGSRTRSSGNPSILTKCGSNNGGMISRRACGTVSSIRRAWRMPSAVTTRPIGTGIVEDFHAVTVAPSAPSIAANARRY